MAFDQSTLTNDPIVTVDFDNVALDVSWTTSSPAGTHWQVYVDRHLTWCGTAHTCTIPYPGHALILIQVGAVLAAEAFDDLSATLPAGVGTGNRCKIQFEGGLYLAPDTDHYEIVGSAVPGGPVVTTTILANISVGIGGLDLGGFGLGPFGHGGFGMGSCVYSWLSDPLANGVWIFQVRAYDHAHNASTLVSVTFTSQAAPTEPAPFADGRRLHQTTTARITTLTWNV